VDIFLDLVIRFIIAESQLPASRHIFRCFLHSRTIAIGWRSRSNTGSRPVTRYRIQNEIRTKSEFRITGFLFPGTLSDRQALSRRSVNGYHWRTPPVVLFNG
jgi:hypothetical protein